MREKRTAQTSLFDPAIDHPLADGLERASVWLDEHPELRRDRRRSGRRYGGGARSPRADLRDDSALRGTQASAPGDLPGAGVCVAGLAFGTALRARGHGAAAEEVSAAGGAGGGERDDLGAHQSALAWRGERGGDRNRKPATYRQHGDPYAYPGTRRQPPAVRRDTRAEPVARHGAQALGAASRGVSRSPSGGTLEIGSRRGARRSKTYRKLLVGAAHAGLRRPCHSAKPELLLRVVDQTQRRVFGETVPAAEKVLSLFEPHTDIILKGGRGTHFHKVNFATGRSGLVLDTVVEKGNPADSARSADA